ncbi:hypothetical protein KIH79_11980 [Bifidobacterium sp. 82T10]|uniref:Ethanolamine utilization protein EutL n=1 Tax=Bifidobacterium miconis TaxID=2834435 RepID=A0ABS6WHV5_9BIFI|nr:hypothetical protein [Bifidobacterium miconis]MBW3093626.1 hypothetical protein [Bifidobacterium miconis]
MSNSTFNPNSNNGTDQTTADTDRTVPLAANRTDAADDAQPTYRTYHNATPTTSGFAFTGTANETDATATGNGTNSGGEQHAAPAEGQQYAAQGYPQQPYGQYPPQYGQPYGQNAPGAWQQPPMWTAQNTANNGVPGVPGVTGVAGAAGVPQGKKALAKAWGIVAAVSLVCGLIGGGIGAFAVTELVGDRGGSSSQQMNMQMPGGGMGGQSGNGQSGNGMGGGIPGSANGQSGSSDGQSSDGQSDSSGSGSSSDSSSYYGSSSDDLIES